MKTFENKDDMNAAIEGIAQFCHNFCMNCAETEKQNDLVFRCKGCPFCEQGSVCRVKVFLKEYATPEQFEKAISMGTPSI